MLDYQYFFGVKLFLLLGFSLEQLVYVVAKCGTRLLVSSVGNFLPI